MSTRRCEIRSLKVQLSKVGFAKVRAVLGIFLPPLVPLLDALLEDFEMFRVRHCRMTSLASGMLRMTLEGHTLCDSSRPVNANTRLLRPARPASQRVCSG